MSLQIPSVMLLALTILRAKSTQAAGLLLALMVVGGPVSAQDYRNYFTVQHSKQFGEDWKTFYEEADRRTAAVKNALPHKLDIEYGPNERNKLDLYFPKSQPTKGAPVFLFIHGGGFREGDKANYGFVAESFAGRGYITVVPNYRLTIDGFRYPSQPQDMHRALTWIYHNIAQYGGDPNRIYVGGHSVGGILTAEVSVRGQWLKENKLPEDLIKGIAAISQSIPVGNPKAAIGGGIYEVRKAEGNAYESDPAHRDEANPLLAIDMTPPRALFAVGSEETIYYHNSAQAFVKEITRRGNKAEFLVLKDQKHADTALALSDPTGTLFTAIMRTFEQ